MDPDRTCTGALRDLPEIWIPGFTQIFTEEPIRTCGWMSAVSDGEDTITLRLARDADQLAAFHVMLDDVELDWPSTAGRRPRRASWF
ncbi:MAG: hypothetical protein R3D98_03555 [Candidatus Krumholzibacteriia bacterium]